MDFCTTLTGFLRWQSRHQRGNMEAVEIWNFKINVALYLSGTVLVLSSNAGRGSNKALAKTALDHCGMRKRSQQYILWIWWWDTCGETEICSSSTSCMTRWPVRQLTASIHNWSSEIKSLWIGLWMKHCTSINRHPLPLKLSWHQDHLGQWHSESMANRISVGQGWCCNPAASRQISFYSIYQELWGPMLFGQV